MLPRRFRASLGIISSVAMLSAALAVPAMSAPRTQGHAAEATAVEGTGESQTYIVVLADDPVAVYDGDVPGYAATRGANPNSAKVRKYERFLAKEADRALRRAGLQGVAKGRSFSHAVSGFTAELDEVQAAVLRKDAKVLTVAPNEIHQLTTNSTPDFLGLTADGGLYDQGLTGEGVVVGVIDSGIWPENPSFAGDSPGRSERRNENKRPSWFGLCEKGEQFNPTPDCNDKLIGARYYADGFGGGDAIKAQFPLEYISPRDADGHGTHTASTAAGNADVETPFGTISGIAPDAKIAAYKVCWGYQGQGGCATADSVAAIDDAVADGVDVINYSISGTASNYLNPVEVAFLFAADAGVVVNASAGNSGPGLSTANHPSPWINTVAAGTEDAAFAGEIILGNGEEYGGRPSIGSEGTDPLPLIRSVELAADDSAAGIDAARLCRADSLAGADGYMVVCERGAIARVAKSDEVARAGGAAMILANVDDNSSLNSDAHVVPTLHVDNETRIIIYGYMDSVDSPTGELTPARVETIVAPDPAGFSARGPIGAADVLKPDILAPGVDILAAYSPNIGGRDFDFLSGTSMSSPHAAGHAALLKEAFPDFSSAAIQSAMMTTAYQTRTDGSPIGGGPLAWGSGHIDPNASVSPGLVYDAGFADWLGFLCGVGQLTASFCPAISIDPSNLNEPNIGVAELAFTETVTRTVTNVGAAGTYEVSVDAPEGVAVEVSPSSFTIGEGESVSYEVTFTTQDDATIGEWTFGSLTWSDGTHDVRSTLAVVPVALAAPDTLTGSGVEGSVEYDVTFGYAGEFTPAAHGLEAATTFSNTIEDDPESSFNVSDPLSGQGVQRYEIEVPDGQAFTRIALFDEYTTNEFDDLDLFIYTLDENGEEVFTAFAAAGGSTEIVDFVFPEAGTYVAYVHAWETEAATTDYTLFAWSIDADPAADDGSLSVTDPGDAVLGGTATITASWTGLEEATEYLGAVSYTGPDGLIGLTLVEVDTN